MTPACQLREAVAADAPALSLVAAATFLESYAGQLRGEDILLHCQRHHSSQAYARWLADPTAKCWVVEADQGQAMVGYQLLAVPDVPVADLSPTDIELKRLYLLHRFQGGGLGRALVQAAAEWASGAGYRRLLLGVYSQNHAALRFYERMGFVRVGERTFHVGNSDFFDYILGLSL